MIKAFIDQILRELNALSTSNFPVPEELFVERIGRDLFDLLLVDAGSNTPGIRKARKEGYVFYNGFDQKNMPFRLSQLNFSFPTKE